MKNHALFTVDVFHGGNVPGPLLKQYAQLRYACFDREDPYVKMDHEKSMELDQFDSLPSTLYVMVTSKKPRCKKQLVSAVRLIPTLQSYDLEQPSWAYLTQHLVLPKSAQVVEGSRWVGKSSRTYEGAIASALLMLQLYQFSQERGYLKMIGVVTEKGEAWLARREANASRDGVLYAIPGDVRIMVSVIDFDTQFLAASRQLMLDSMMHWSVSHTAVAAVMQ